MYDTIKFIQEKGHDVRENPDDKIQYVDRNTGEIIINDAIPLVTSNHDDFDASLHKYDNLFDIDNEVIQIVEKE